MKRLLSLLLALCLMGTMVPFQAFAAEDADASAIVTEAPVVADEESIVERIEVPDMTIMQCSKGWNELIYDEHDDQVIGYKFVSLGRMTDFIKNGDDPNTAWEKASGSYGRVQDAVKFIDPRKE